MSWFAVHARPMHEATAAKELRRQGVTTFFPVSRIRRHVRRGHEMVPRWSTRPYYPTWLFVETDVRRLHVVTSTRGVCCMASMGGVPAAIPIAVMAALMSGADGAGVMTERDDAARRRFRERAIVEFCAGSPLAEMIATIVSDTGGHHVDVSINILGASRTISVPADSVRISGRLRHSPAKGKAPTKRPGLTAYNQASAWFQVVPGNQG